MATNASQHGRSECGIIILGNTGLGKSFLCNILLEKDRFQSEVSAKSVTKETDHSEITMPNGRHLLIFNIPGLIERRQDEIEKNKQQIVKAFEQCPNSFVIFVWSASEGGRVQYNDFIGFGSLYKAYEFPLKSLIYIVNKVPTGNNDQKFQAEFLTEIKEGLEQEEKLTVDPKDVVFLEQMDTGNEKQKGAARKKIFECIWKHQSAIQSKKADIILQADELKKLREALERHLAEAKKDRETHDLTVKQMYEDVGRNQVAAEKDRGKYDHTGFPVDPAALLMATTAGAVSGALSGAARGFGDGFQAVAKSVDKFANDTDIPVTVRVVGTPVLVVASVIAAPVVAVAGAIGGAADGFAKGVEGAWKFLTGKK